MESTAQRERFAALLDAAAQVSEQPELHDVLESLVDIAMGLTGAKYGALGVVGSHGFLVDFIHRGIGPETAEAIGHLPLGLGVLGSITRGDTVRTNAISTHPDSGGMPEHHPDMTSFLGVPLRTRNDVFGNLYLADKSGGFTEDDQTTIETLSLIAGSAIANVRIHRRLREAAIAEDRARIARDVHDDIIQDLFAVGLSLQSFADSLDDQADGSVVRTQVARVDDCITSLRQFIFNLRQPATHMRDLEIEVTELVEELAEPYSADVEVAVDSMADGFTNEIADAVLHIIKEATSNALRHSGSPIVRVLITGGFSNLSVSVIDRGHGFDPNHQHSGMGLANLRKRAFDVGGDLALKSSSNGTTVTLVLPIG
ncbi:MAG: GAF domain-containing protein [Acidimicrobiia bacterium]|nr:GAF domain-containing protein [Acidimicrobiia bacterium]MDX2466428.1 GAF domain-containing protein [Acidimicrobiia bacterium]